MPSCHYSSRGERHADESRRGFERSLGASTSIHLSDDETKTRLHAFLEKRAPKVAPVAASSGSDGAGQPAG